MTSPASSSSFELLDPRLQRWIWQQGWPTLREVQQRSIPVVGPLERDVIITASTAAGKTEAAYLPILSSIAGSGGVSVLSISPLKALINDQYERLCVLGEPVGVPVHRWHGDVPRSEKLAFVRAPGGILLITPESLEAALMREPRRARGWFAELRAVVIDEFHAFVGGERGVQLLSQLARIDAPERFVPRIALSATLGDTALAASALRPSAPDDVVVVDAGGGHDLRLRVFGYVQSEETPPAMQRVAGALFDTLRGGKHLAFCNSRSDVEELTDALVARSEHARVPPEFTPHHGSLSRGIREHAEAVLKQPGRPMTVICTSTLELGIDVGHVESIAQVGVPTSVSALRQRLGRSGRAGSPSILRLHVLADRLEEGASLEDRLRMGLVQTVACVRLLVRGWFEPPAVAAMHASTLVQQLLSILVQHGGLSAAGLWAALMTPDGPFDIDRGQYLELLRSLGRRDIVEQAEDGTLLLGAVGERIAHHYSFYAAFQSSEEYRIVTAGRMLGTLPVDVPLAVDDTVIFAGRRWRVEHVDGEARTVSVVPHGGGRAPRFLSDGGLVHDRVVAEMRRVYEDLEVYEWLDPAAASMLVEARAEYERLGLSSEIPSVVEEGEDLLVLPWTGSVALRTIHLLLRHGGLESALGDHHLLVRGAGRDDLAKSIAGLLEAPPSAEGLAATVENLRLGKHDWMLDEDLLLANYASHSIDVPTALDGLRDLVDAKVRDPAPTAEPDEGDRR